ncbi:MAG TPA: tetratricopeptide repeat protein [Leptolyngbyaceae cyanobacterium M65_K2018_010]|nr:tetratricopeptide repeat protein [Leptolyngbyaceae cyanobacterium M65_K2018_010]
MTVDSLALAKTEYAYGQDAFEHGNYRQAVSHFEKALDLAQATTPLGGEIQTWLVNAYSAVGQATEAIALCETLTRHPDLEIRKQAKNLLYILQAPQLKRPGNWMSEIPDLGAIDEGRGEITGQVLPRVSPQAAPKPKPDLPPITADPSNPKENGFLWIALVALALVLGGVAWLS